MGVHQCELCHKKADRLLTHKETKEVYGFCSECEKKGYYNPKIFDCEPINKYTQYWMPEP